MSEPLDSSIPPHAASSAASWIKFGTVCLAIAAATFLAMVVLIGPGNLPPQVKQQVDEKPWVFGLFVLICGSVAATGGHGVIHRRAFNVVQDSLAPSEYTGRKAVVIGAIQCFAGSAAVGALLFLLLIR